jgi:hypothetical protein
MMGADDGAVGCVPHLLPPTPLPALAQSRLSPTSKASEETVAFSIDGSASGLVGILPLYRLARVSLGPETWANQSSPAPPEVGQNVSPANEAVMTPVACLWSGQERYLAPQPPSLPYEHARGHRGRGGFVHDNAQAALIPEMTCRQRAAAQGTLAVTITVGMRVCERHATMEEASIYHDGGSVYLSGLIYTSIANQFACSKKLVTASLMRPACSQWAK